jgi:hypothetical protein
MTITVQQILLEIFQVMNIFFPSIPFVFQIRKFFINRSSIGFSRNISLILITSSVLRIFFWFGKYFHWTLLVQSFLLIFTQVFVIEVAIKFSNKKEHLYPWSKIEWDRTLCYLTFLVIFILLLEIISVFFTFQNIIYVESLGTLSSIMEAFLPIPQIYENFKRKSTENLSNVLVGCWILGDSMKTFYYYISKAPIQLLVSGLVQIVLDLVVILQICIYRVNDPLQVSLSSK